ncbi:serine protease inhibitor 88Ea-like [Diprion similis]|uniref:serine protease inhibitor 88Ea-like n=1 Tax=Diprion similis TaxID=362088 RepID=UPI001EF84870|nr:serine protease inhibitor 88Ea-like [Diprion similis]XP_046746949.1 serine protease inhibitor 88Ea-like [Diprion similis]
MYNTVFVCLALCSAFLGMTSGQCMTENDNPTTMERDFNEKLSQARLDFAFDTLRILSEFEDVDNIFYSPHSLHEALTLAYFSARGETEAGLKRALHVPETYSKTHVQRFYVLENSLRRFIAEQGNASTSYEFNTANKLWVTKERRLRECMLDLFGSELEQVDFRADPEAIRERINQWTSNATKGHIQDLIPADGITGDSNLVLASAVYFKGLWKSKFDTANSKKDNFYSNGSRTHLVTFMKQKGTFSHVVSEEIGAHILQLPYKGDEISMYVLLPPFAGARAAEGNESFDGVQQLIKRITGTGQASQELREILNDGMAAREVDISMPKFNVDKELPLNPLLIKMGANNLLTPTADLTGLLQDGEPSLHLGDAVHRAVVEVTEEGTKATAATAIFSFRSSRPAEPAVFNANHPFLYFIYNRLTRSILFAGVYRTPLTTTSVSYD